MENRMIGDLSERVAFNHNGHQTPIRLLTDLAGVEVLHCKACDAYEVLPQAEVGSCVEDFALRGEPVPERLKSSLSAHLVCCVQCQANMVVAGSSSLRSGDPAEPITDAIERDVKKKMRERSIELMREWRAIRAREYTIRFRKHFLAADHVETGPFFAIVECVGYYAELPAAERACLRSGPPIVALRRMFQYMHAVPGISDVSIWTSREGRPDLRSTMCRSAGV